MEEVQHHLSLGLGNWVDFLDGFLMVATLLLLARTAGLS